MAVLLLVTEISPCDPCQTTQCVVPRTAMLAYRGNLTGQWIGLGACVPQTSMDVIIPCDLNSCPSTTIALPMALVVVSRFDQTRMTAASTHVDLHPHDRTCPIALSDSPMTVALETSDHSRLPLAWKTFLKVLAVTALLLTQENLLRVLIWTTAGYSPRMISHQGLEEATEAAVVAMPQPRSLQARVMAANLHQSAKLNPALDDRVDGELPSKPPLLLQHPRVFTQTDSSILLRILHRSRLPMPPSRLLLPLAPVVGTMPSQAPVDLATTVDGVTSVSLESTTCFSKPTALPSALLLMLQPPRHLVERVQTGNRILATLLFGFLTVLVAKVHLKMTAALPAAAPVVVLVI